MMISNLQSARALIQADLNHARKVLDLWSQQVSDLEKALQQIDAVGDSRKILSNEYKGARGGAPRLMNAATPGTAARDGRKPKIQAAATGTAKKRRAKLQSGSPDTVASAAEGGNDERSRKPSTGAVNRKPGKVEAKYKDPHSDKTWSGRGRRPAWFTGAPEQYLIPSGSLQHEAASASSAVH
jgi:DNA-binding protein H-NS